MHIITRKRLMQFCETYPTARNPLGAWAKTVDSARWAKFSDVRQTWNSADWVHGEYCVFNVNSDRIVAHIHYQRDMPDGETKRGTVFIRHIFTHSEYETWSKNLKRTGR